jgi:hypothetical protein
MAAKKVSQRASGADEAGNPAVPGVRRQSG